MRGKHSWQVTGPSSQNATITQLLDKETVEYIRNRKDSQQRGVCFSFWYLPDGVDDSGGDKGEKNKARAEIECHDGWWHTVVRRWVKPNDDESWFSVQLNSSLLQI